MILPITAHETSPKVFGNNLNLGLRCLTVIDSPYIDMHHHLSLSLSLQFAAIQSTNLAIKTHPFFINSINNYPLHHFKSQTPKPFFISFFLSSATNPCNLYLYTSFFIFSSQYYKGKTFFASGSDSSSIMIDDLWSFISYLTSL